MWWVCSPKDSRAGQFLLTGGRSTRAWGQWGLLDGRECGGEGDLGQEVATDRKVDQCGDGPWGLQPA